MKKYTYQEAIDFFKNLPHFKPPKDSDSAKKDFFSLDAELALLEMLGNPQKDLKYIHVAGTNGKGSTANYIGTILEKTGVKTGCFTSPFLRSYNELFRVNHVDISDEDFAEVFSVVKEKYDELVVQNIFPSEYEFLTVMGFCYFKKMGCDCVVLEVSLGGRVDTTNVIPAPIVTVITPISYDHMSILGNTLAEIAAEKAGIIKPGTIVVSAKQEDEVAAVLEAVCKDKKVGIEYAEEVELVERSLEGQKFRVNSRDKSFIGHLKLETSNQNVKLADEESTVFETSLLGTYQLDNAALAILAVRKLSAHGFDITEDDIICGIKDAKWFGRFTIVDRNPITIVDGGHNRQGAKALRESLEAYFPNKKVTFVLGILKDKEVELIIRELLPVAKEFYCVAVPNERTMPPEELAQMIIKLGGRASVPENGFDIKGFASKEDIICVAGSLYLNGNASK